MADTLLRSPDGTRVRWFNEKEVAHLTNKEPGECWTVVVTDEKPPRDPHDDIEEAPIVMTEVEEETPTNDIAKDDAPEEAPVRRPKPKPLPKSKQNKGRSR